jgi:hypothetical protein
MLGESTGRTPSIFLLLIIMAMFANSTISKWNSTVYGHIIPQIFFFLKSISTFMSKKKNNNNLFLKFFFLRINFNILIFTSNQSLFIIF